MTAHDLPMLASNRRTSAFERRFARALAVHLEPSEPVVVACSGGPDSLATLVATARSRPPGTVTAAHFDHRLRPAAEVARERAIVATIAAATGTLFSSGRASRVPVDRGEAAAREARYRWLARACRAAGATVCITGHTRDDQAETVLLRLVRGTGLGGAAGMERVAPWPLPGRSSPRLLRPLLDVARTEVESYLDALRIEAARDPSNDTLDYARNRVRQRVIPELCALNPRASAHVAAFADRARDDDAALEAWAAAALTEIGRTNGETLYLDRDAVLALPPAIGGRVVRLAAERLGVTVERAAVEAALHAARAGGRRAALGGGVEAGRQGGWLVVGRSPLISPKSSVHPLALTDRGATILRLPRTGSQNT